MSAQHLGVAAALVVVASSGVFRAFRRAARSHAVRSRISDTQSATQFFSRLPTWPAAIVGAVSIAMWLGSGTTIVVALVALAGYVFIKKRRHGKAVERFERDLPVALDAVARSMRSGAGVLIAFEEAGRDLDGPVADDFAAIGKQVRLGRDFGDALDIWTHRRGMQSVRLTAASMKLAMKTGAAQAEVVDRVALSVRQQLSAIASAKTHATQARASAWALTLLPIGFTGPMLVVDAATREFLLHTWIGIAVLIIGLGLDGLGALWMSRLVKRAVA